MTDFFFTLKYASRGAGGVMGGWVPAWLYMFIL